MVWQNRTDGELLDDFLATENAVFLNELVRRHGRMVLGVCRRVAGSAIAEDAAQMVFLAMLRRAESLSQRSSIGGWLYRAAWNVASRARRDAAARHAYEVEAARHRQQQYQPAEPLDDQFALLHRAMNLLPVAYRDALVLHHLEGYTVEEVAGIMGCPVGTTAARLSRGRMMLREQLEVMGVGLSVSTLATLLRDELIEQAELILVDWSARAAAASLLGSVPIAACATMGLPVITAGVSSAVAKGVATASLVGSMLRSQTSVCSGTAGLGSCESAGQSVPAVAASAVPIVGSAAAFGVAGLATLKSVALGLMLLAAAPVAGAVVYGAGAAILAGASGAGGGGAGNAVHAPREPAAPVSYSPVHEGHSVPEPGTLVLVGPALTAILLRRRRGAPPTA